MSPEPKFLPVFEAFLKLICRLRCGPAIVAQSRAPVYILGHKEILF